MTRDIVLKMCQSHENCDLFHTRLNSCFVFVFYKEHFLELVWATLSL